MTVSEHLVAKFVGRAVCLRVKSARSRFVWATVGGIGASQFHVITPTWEGLDCRRSLGLAHSLLRRSLLGGYSVRYSDVESITIDPPMDPVPFIKAKFCPEGCPCPPGSCQSVYMAVMNRGETTAMEISERLGAYYDAEDEIFTVTRFSWETDREVEDRVGAARVRYAAGVHSETRDKRVFFAGEYADLLLREPAGTF